MRRLLILSVVLAACGADPSRPEVQGPAAAPPAPREDTGRAPAARADEREDMVRTQIAARGVEDPLVLAAMRAAPRHEFVTEGWQAQAYSDAPLPIGWNQTISQPYMVASMTEELRLRPGDRVLEIGTGSGYQAAVLAEITDEVYTVEIGKALADAAAERLERLGYAKVHARHGDGYFGWAEAAPFDAIVVTAAAPQVPPPLVEQLAPGGRMVIPVGTAFATQTLVLVTKAQDGSIRTKSLYAVRFVPFTRGSGDARATSDRRDEGD